MIQAKRQRQADDGYYGGRSAWEPSLDQRPLRAEAIHDALRNIIARPNPISTAASPALNATIERFDSITSLAPVRRTRR